MKKLSKKGVLDQLSGLIIALGSIAIVLVVTFLIVAEGQDQIVEIEGVNESDTATWSIGYNATQEVQEAMQDVPGWLPIVVITVIGGVLLLLVKVFRQ